MILKNRKTALPKGPRKKKGGESYEREREREQEACQVNGIRRKFIQNPVASHPVYPLLPIGLKSAG
jgi:hypothetical protein